MAEQAKEEQKPNEDLQKKVSDLENQNKLLVKEAMEKKDQIRQLEETRRAEEEKSLKEQNKYKELYEGSLPKLERLNKLEPTLNQMLDTEIAEVPEDKRELIPAFSQVEDKLLWIRQAKSKGLFIPAKAEEKKAPANSVQSKISTGQTAQEFLSWSANDPRLTSLSVNEYKLWKAQNHKSASGMKGWGG